MNDFKLIYVKWCDAYGENEWRKLSAIDTTPATCETVGWLVKEENESSVIANTIHREYNEAACYMVIPNALIIERRVLSLSKPK